MKVLITSLGSNTSIGVLKGIRMMLGNSITLVGTDIFPKNECAGSSFVDQFFVIKSSKDAAGYESDLIKIIQREGVNCVIPIHDKEIDVVAVLAQKYPLLTFWAVNSPEVVQICNNKIGSNRVAEKLDIVVPHYQQSINNLSFPVIIKEISGVSSRGISIAKSETDLQTALANGIEKYIVQELVQDGIEYTVDCYSSYRGKFVGGVARRRMETKDGMSTKGKVEDVPILIGLCERFLNSLNYKGASNIQFIVKEGIPYFIEINPRFSGGGVLSYRANFNSPCFTIQEAMGEAVEFDRNLIKYGTQMTRHWEEIFYNEEGDRI